MSAVDGLALAANALGHLGDNAGSRPPLAAAGPRSLAVFVDRFPAISETFVAERGAGALAAGLAGADRGGRPTRAPAARRRARVARRLPRGRGARDPAPSALAWLIARHPLRCAADLAARGRLAAGRAAAAARAGAGRAAARARRRRARARPLRRAGGDPRAARRAARRESRSASPPTATTSTRRRAGCARSSSGPRSSPPPASTPAATCRRLLEPAARDKVQRVVMGVDGERFRRRTRAARATARWSRSGATSRRRASATWSRRRRSCTDRGVERAGRDRRRRPAAPELERRSRRARARRRGGAAAAPTASTRFASCSRAPTCWRCRA